MTFTLSSVIDLTFLLSLHIFYIIYIPTQKKPNPHASYYAVIVPTLLRGEELYTQMSFFCSVNFDRSIYIHHTEFWVVSLKSPSSVKYEIKKILLNFVFYRELSMFEILWIIDEFPLFLFTHSGILPKMLSFLLKIVKIVYNFLFILFLETKKILLTFLIYFFWLKFWLRISKFSLFHQKLSEISFFSPFWLNLLEVHTPKTTNTIFVNYKLSCFYFQVHWE